MSVARQVCDLFGLPETGCSSKGDIIRYAFRKQLLKSILDVKKMATSYLQRMAMIFFDPDDYGIPEEVAEEIMEDGYVMPIYNVIESSRVENLALITNLSERADNPDLDLDDSITCLTFQDTEKLSQERKSRLISGATMALSNSVIRTLKEMSKATVVHPSSFLIGEKLPEDLYI